VEISWAGTAISPFEEIAYRPIDPLDIDPGVKARTVRPFVENTNHGERVGILDARCQVEFTGDGHNGLGSVLHDDSTGQGPSCGHGDLDVILLRKFKEVLDQTSATPAAFVNISGDFDVTVKILDAMRQKKQNLSGLCPVMVGHHQLVIDGNEGLLNPPTMTIKGNKT
jgi:hypothetical protein